MKHDATRYPAYLIPKLAAYPVRTCINCGAPLIVRIHRNHKAAPTNNRQEFILEKKHKYAAKRYCGYRCSALHRAAKPPTPAPRATRSPTTRSKPKPGPWMPPVRQRVATAFSALPVSKGAPPPPTPEQRAALQQAIDAHPLLGKALLGTFTDAWWPWSSAVTSPNRRSTRT